MAKKNNTNDARNETTKRGLQTFACHAPGATSVQLVGDFTGWQQAPVQMQKGADGSWQAAVKLSPGAHHYRFLVDGQWRDDPACPLHEPNPFGSQDSIRQVA